MVICNLYGGHILLVIKKESFLKEYKKLDKEFNLKWDATFEKLVNFSQTSDIPIHNWFYYQEGFSPILVKRILEKLSIKKGSVLFDPFSGSGTSMLSGKDSGLKTYGFELNPFSHHMIKAKTQNYSKIDLEIVKNFKIPQHKKMDKLSEKYDLRIIENLFERDDFEKIEILKKKINKVENKKSKIILFACLLSILSQVSKYRKGGNGLKRKRRFLQIDPYEIFDKKRKDVLDDLSNQKGYEPKVKNDTCLNMDKYSIPLIDISLFSPPYANCFDPFEVYKIELWVGEFVTTYEELRHKRKTALTSNLNADVTKNVSDQHKTELLDNILNYLSGEELWNKRIVKMLNVYFNDMFVVLEKIYKNTQKDGYCVIVVGNSAYGNLAIPTDLILGQLGQKVGFNVSEIIVARNNETSSQQHLKLEEYTEYLRESIIILRK